MKYPIMLLILFCLSGSARAQLLHFRAVQFICTRYQNEPMEPPEFKDLDSMKVEFDMDSSILYIHSPAIQVFHLEGKPFSISEKDSVMTYRFNGADIKGVKCVIQHDIYESEKAPHFASFWLEYPDKIYMYYVERS